MSMSNRARRMAEHHSRHRAEAELNLIPLIDILSVMVAFLLVYSTEVEVIQNTKGIEVPQSIAEVTPRKSVVVMITRDDLFVQGERIASVADIVATQGIIIGPLRAALKRPMLAGDIALRDLASREITVLGDKSLPYEVLKKVMATCTDADYGRISLAVIQKEKPAPAGRAQASLNAQTMLLAPFYRTYDLAWEGDPEASARFRRILRVGLIVLLVLGILFPILPKPKRDLAEEAIPPRLARVMIENQVKPPPPPPPVEEKPKIEPEKKVAAIKPPVDRTQQARERAQATLEQFQDELADLREEMDLTPLEQTRNLTGAVGADSHAERSLISSKVGRASGGITTANSSRGFGTGAGSLTGHSTTAVTSNIARGDRGPTRSGSSGRAARSREEIELVFDRNKGAIYALYSRALREQPQLQGKMVLEFTVAPSGQVTMCRVVSSELNDPQLEGKIVARVRMFRFEPRDVETVTTTKPIDFFPA